MDFKSFVATLLGIESTTVYPSDYSALKAENANLKIEVKSLKGIVADLKTTLANTSSTVTNFSSLAELKAFLKYTRIDKEEYVASTHDCDDFARDLQWAALSWNGGRIINAQLTDDGRHMLNTAVIGNELYQIEPQTDEVTLLCNLD